MKQKNNTTLEKKPNPFLFYPLGFCLKTYCKVFYKLKSNKIELDKEGGVILANHLATLDGFFQYSALFPVRINMVAAYYYFINKRMGKFLRTMGVIPKYQFSSDNLSLKRMFSVIKNNGYLCLMPEGTVAMTGTVWHVPFTIAKLLKRFKKNVYVSRIKGASITCPKWATHFKKGQVEVETILLIKKEDLINLSEVEIYNKIVEALKVDDFDYAKQNNLTYKGKNKAEGLEKLLHICPKCHDDSSMTTSGDFIICNKCGLKAKLNDKMLFEFEGKNYFENYYQWYDYQRECYCKEIALDNFEITDNVKYISLNEGKQEYEVLHNNGVMSLTKAGFKYTYTKNNEQIIEIMPLKTIPTLVIDAGKNFELPYTDHIRCFEPSDRTKIIKWAECHRILYDTSIEELNNVIDRQK